MPPTKLILLAILTLFLSCTHEETKNNKVVKIDTSTAQKKLQNVIDTTGLLKKIEENSFVISCGSGCAMRYNVQRVSGNRSLIEVEFAVEMLEDGIETDEHSETFYFYYNARKRLEKILRDEEHEGFLETQMPKVQRAFNNFSDNLILEFD